MNSDMGSHLDKRFSSHEVIMAVSAPLPPVAEGKLIDLECMDGSTTDQLRMLRSNIKNYIMYW